MTNNEEKSKDMSSSAIDTGKRIDISNLPSLKTTIRLVKSKVEKEEAKKEESKKEEIEVKIPIPKKNIPPIKKPILDPVVFDEGGDFASLLEEMDHSSGLLSINVGDKVKGKIIHIGEENAFISLSPKVEAAIATGELKDEKGNLKYSLGDYLSAYVLSTSNGITLSNQMANKALDFSMIEEAKNKKMPIMGKVIELNKGGFTVDIAGKRAFCPISQIDDKFVEDPNLFIGKNLNFLVEKIEEGGKNIVVSRRLLLDRQKREEALKILPSLSEGQTFQAVITRVADFGAFADIGGVEGLIPRSELSHGHIDKPSDVISVGDNVEVMVLSCDKNFENPKKTKLSLSVKQTKQDPYLAYIAKINEGASIEGKVVRLESFGAFVELFPGIDGLIHISELSENRVAHPKDVLAVGDPVTVRILSIDQKEKRISLSLREAVERKNKESIQSLSRGQKVKGVVSRIERYGVFLSLSTGQTALMPISETGLPPHSDLGKGFKIGDALEVLVIEIDPQNRIRVSLVAKEKADERDSFLSFQNKENLSGFGTLGDLLKKSHK